MPPAPGAASLTAPPRSLLAAGLSRALGLLLLGLTFWLTYHRPVGGALIAGVLLTAAVAQLRWPDAWLVSLPALLPGFDLTLWSGRLYVDEIDLLVLLTAALHFLRAPAGHLAPRFQGRGGVLTLLLAAAFAISALIGAWPLPAPSANALGSYLSHYNALRVLKSLVWALLLLAPLQAALARGGERAGRLLTAGTALGLISLGLLVLWERGVLLAILQSGGHIFAARYAILGALLDFTSEYRAT